jgi:hypothetical protein
VSCKLLGKLSVVNHRTLGLSRAATAQTTRSNTGKRVLQSFPRLSQTLRLLLPPAKMPPRLGLVLMMTWAEGSKYILPNGPTEGPYYLWRRTHTPLASAPFHPGPGLDRPGDNSHFKRVARLPKSIHQSHGQQKRCCLCAANGLGAFGRRLTGSTPPWQTVARIVEGFNSAH